MLDDFNKLKDADKSGFLAKLARLPGSYDGPEGLRAEPYGLMGFGEGAGLSRALQGWLDAPLVVSGTQFLLASGFDYGDLSPLKLSAELAGAEVVVLGYDAYQPNLHVPPGPLSFYHYVSYLAHATGHTQELTEAERVMGLLRERLGPEVKTAQNPAKTLAWALWNRVPLLLSAKANTGLPEILQRVFARVGKSLAITAGDHPLEVLSGAFEGRHQLGDDVVAIIAGETDEEMRLAEELLSTRIAQVERLDLPFGGVGEDITDAGAKTLVLWYVTLWVAAYLALLHQLSPEDSKIYEELAKAAQTP